MAKDLTLALWLFTLGYYVEHIGSAIMIYKLHKQKSIYGISIGTQTCLLVATVARIFWMLDTQLTRLALAQLEIWIALAMHGYIVYLCYSYKDNIYKGVKELYLKSPALIIGCLLLSFIFHPGSKGNFFFTLQMFVSFTIFLEAVSILPQIAHLRQNKDPEGLTSTYLYFLGGSRIGRFFFWIAMISNNDTFWYLILADLIHTGLLIGFFYTYKVAVKTGGPILAFTDKPKHKDF